MAYDYKKALYGVESPTEQMDDDTLAQLLSDPVAFANWRAENSRSHVKAPNQGGVPIPPPPPLTGASVPASPEDIILGVLEKMRRKERGAGGVPLPPAASAKPEPPTASTASIAEGELNNLAALQRFLVQEQGIPFEKSDLLSKYKTGADAELKAYKDRKPEISDKELALNLILMSAKALEYDPWNPRSGLSRLGAGAGVATSEGLKQLKASQEQIDKEHMLRLQQLGTEATLGAGDLTANNAGLAANSKLTSNNIEALAKTLASSGTLAHGRTQIDTQNRQIDAYSKHFADDAAIKREANRIAATREKPMTALDQLYEQIKFGTELRKADPSGKGAKLIAEIQNKNKPIPTLEGAKPFMEGFNKAVMAGDWNAARTVAGAVGVASGDANLSTQLIALVNEAEAVAKKK